MLTAMKGVLTSDSSKKDLQLVYSVAASGL